MDVAVLDGWKVCNRCGEEKQLEDYYLDRKQADGRKRYCKVCRKAAVAKSRRARRAYRKQHRAEISAKLIALKMTLSCVDCLWYPSTPGECWLLHFDHIDPSTKWSQSHNAAAFQGSWKWDRIEAEIVLCQPRCRTCHLGRTWRQLHGQDPYPLLPYAERSLPPHTPPTQVLAS